MDVLRLAPAHAATYRELMLRAYAEDPEAFTATVPEREPLPSDFWESRLSDDPDSTELVFGAFEDDRLVGAAGLRYRRRQKTKHKAWLFGMAVSPEARGRGIGRALVEAVLDQARSTPGVLLVQLTVTESNTAAVELYESCGFSAFGKEPLALRMGDRFVPKVHMWCPVGEIGAVRS